MSDRIILHCDLNNFFASVTLLSNPTLYDLPVAVCGSVEARHGIVLAKNELAKNQGVNKMPKNQAFRGQIRVNRSYITTISTRITSK